jgi:hypothetical protein
MRFVLGPIPDDPGFDPTLPPWNAIREPRPALMNLIALPIMLVTLGLMALFLHAFTNLSLTELAGPFLVAFLLVIPIHELTHALVMPGSGRGGQTMIGFWPSHLLFYAFHFGELTRRNFLLVMIAPFVVLTLLPLAVLALGGIESRFLGAVAIANGTAAAGDLLGFALILTQIPRGAVVRNQGWRTYWRSGNVEL